MKRYPNVRAWRTFSLLASLPAGLMLFAAAAATQPSESSSRPPSATTLTAAAGDVGRGKIVYEKHCVECHGVSGKGDGPAAALLTPHPRDFSLGRYKIRTTETGSLPTDDDLLRSVRKGLYGSAMPGWDNILADSDLRDVVAYVKSLSARFAEDTPRPIVVGPAVEASPQSIARGANVYAKLQCGKCHGTNGRGTDAAATFFEDDWGQPLRAANLTEPWTFHGGGGAADIYMRFRAGMSGTPMPSFKDAATDAEMWDLANYVVSLARKPAWDMDAEEIAAFYAAEDADARANPVARGKYLADTLGCAICHSPVDANRRMLPGLKWAGGMRIRVDPFGEYPSGNLTSDQQTGLGSWTDEEIKAVLTRGILRDGTRLLPYPMDWASYSTMPPEDLSALIAYLRTIPPIVNRVPRPSRTALPLFLWGKFRMLILGNDPPMTFFAGNVGDAKPVNRSQP